MSDFGYSFLDKSSVDGVLPGLYELFYRNMRDIADIDDPYEAARDAWVELIGRALLRGDARQLVLITQNGRTVGFFMYLVYGGSFVMEEIQLEPSARGTGAFRGLYRWLLPQLPGGILQVTAFTHPKNRHSQAILEHFGFKMSCDGQEPYFRHTMDYSEFAAAFV